MTVSPDRVKPVASQWLATTAPASAAASTNDSTSRGGSSICPSWKRAPPVSPSLGSSGANARTSSRERVEENGTLRSGSAMPRLRSGVSTS